MKKYPKTVLVFFGAGFFMGTLCVAASLAYSEAGDVTVRQIDNLFNHYMIILCPASLGLMALDSPDPGILHMASTYLFIVILNAFIYAYAGAGVVWLIRRFKREIPKTTT